MRIVVGTSHRYITGVGEQVRFYSLTPIGEFMFEESMLTMDYRRSEGMFCPLQLLWWEHRPNNR